MRWPLGHVSGTTVCVLPPFSVFLQVLNIGLNQQKLQYFLVIAGNKRGVFAEYCAVLVAVNSIMQIVLYAPLAVFYIRV